ncbi:right-handed parallel beta-helix repeat-containing protein [Tenacibaculum xiamenense]|uniref:right-handed parallel beta-helix repeat-containing protein n=1 Tax=Tenacibaculum xiamenense TaxID=1261553 RepID=UPI003893B25F
MKKKAHLLVLPFITLITTFLLISCSESHVEESLSAKRNEHYNRASNSSEVTLTTVNEQTINNAINQAGAWLSNNNTSSSTYTINIPSGSHNVGYFNDRASINFINFNYAGRLIIKGEGSKNTTINFTDRVTHEIFMRNCSNITFQGMLMVRDELTVSQGELARDLYQSGGKTYAEINIDQGYPSPQNIYPLAAVNLAAGRYIRRYSDHTWPRVENGTNQWRWDNPTHVSGNTWRLQILGSRGALQEARNYFASGDNIGIKSKCTGQSFIINGSNSIQFIDVTWRLATRGVVGWGSNDILFEDCKILRTRVNGAWSYLSSPGGGPQIGRENDNDFTQNVTFRNCYFAASGDDGIGLFKVRNVNIINTRVNNNFARGILIYKHQGQIIPEQVCQTGLIVRSDRVEDSDGNVYNIPSCN